MRLKWGIDQLYFYLVCFVMLITIIVGVTSLVQSGINLFLPIPENSRFDSPKPAAPSDIAKSTLPQNIVERELKQQQEIVSAQNKKNNINNSVARIFGELAQVIIAIPVYMYHWRKIPLIDR